MPDAHNVFISYARKDGSDYAARLYDNLTAHNITVWRDTRDLDPYTDFTGEIEEAIECATHVAVIVTADVKRRDSFVRLEIAFALEKNKPIIPLVFPGGHRPINIINHTYISVQDWDTGFAVFLERLSRGVEEIDPQNTRELELAYLQAIGQRYDHWRDLYTDMPATAYIEKPRVQVKAGAAARYLDIQHDIFRDIESAFDDDRAKTITVQNFDELHEGIREHKRVALIGDPGAGKTTTLERLAYELATTAAEDEAEPLPLFVRLGAYAGGDFGEFVESSFGGLRLDNYLPGRVFLLLDGLNEMPTEHVPQVEDWLRVYTDTPAIVTCRKLDYVGHKLPLQRIDVSPLDVKRIRLFIDNYLEDADRDRLFWGLGDKPTREAWIFFTRRVDNATFNDFWFGDQEPGNYWDPEQKQLKALRGALSEQNKLPGMLGVVGNPFLLFVTLQIFIHQGELSANHGQLLSQFVTLLMAQRGRPAAQMRPPWINERVQRQALTVLAYQMQFEHTGTSVAAEWASEIIQTALPDADVEHILYLAASASIIEHGKTVRFSHQLLQEYFAAYEMREDLRHGVPATKYWPGDNWWEPTGWEETALLLAGMEGNATEVVRWLIPVQPTLAYHCATESGATCEENALQALYEPEMPPIPIYENGNEVDCWRASLPRITPFARTEWGRLLAAQGDTRKGVGLQANGLPNIDWVRIPAGAFLMGSTDEQIEACKRIMPDYLHSRLDSEKPQHIAELSTYYIARYPVTVAQYEAFVTDDGYQKRQYWTEAGWNERDTRTTPDFWGEPRWHINNHPVIGISWYEAYAFTQWLSTKLNIKVTLPSEAQFEKAARGTDGRTYCWGDGFIPGYANINEITSSVPVGPHFIQRTSAVGMYPQGISPFGVLDALGNIYEWSVTKWRNSYNEPEDNDPEGDAARVLRGGSWFYNVRRARCAYRNKYDPSSRYDAFGFRVVCDTP